MKQEKGPKDGDRVLFCEHADVSKDHIALEGGCHWYEFKDEAELAKHNDGDWFVVRWICLCADCHMRRQSGTNMLHQLRQDAEWIGDSPRIGRVM